MFVISLSISFSVVVSISLVVSAINNLKKSKAIEANIQKLEDTIDKLENGQSVSYNWVDLK